MVMANNENEVGDGAVAKDAKNAGKDNAVTEKAEDGAVVKDAKNAGNDGKNDGNDNHTFQPLVFQPPVFQTMMLNPGWTPLGLRCLSVIPRRFRRDQPVKKGSVVD